MTDFTENSGRDKTWSGLRVRTAFVPVFERSDSLISQYSIPAVENVILLRFRKRIEAAFTERFISDETVEYGAKDRITFSNYI